MFAFIKCIFVCIVDPDYLQAGITYRPKNALDGNTGTFYHIDVVNDPNAWLQIAFGQEVRLSSVTLDFNAILAFAVRRKGIEVISSFLPYCFSSIICFKQTGDPHSVTWGSLMRIPIQF